MSLNDLQQAYNQEHKTWFTHAENCVPCKLRLHHGRGQLCQTGEGLHQSFRRAQEELAAARQEEMYHKGGETS